MTINNKSERNYQGKCLGWPVTSYGADFAQIRIGPILVYTSSFKSFEETGANQELSFPTHVTQHLAMRQISSNSDSNISQVQLPFTKPISP